MYPLDWRNELGALATEGHDIVSIMQIMSGRHDNFGKARFPTIVALRETFGISVIQSHAIAGWLEGNVSDVELREAVTIEPRQ